jgi:alpha-methylacyl-CoA racemase
VDGPLAGVRVVELGGIGPAPYGVMLLADLGASVVRVDRVDAVGRPDLATAAAAGIARNRRSIALDLKRREAVDLVLDLLDDSDVLVEGFRPGVVERLGLGPDVVTSRAPHVVYARMTGWGQDGPLAPRAGHDLDFLALTGALHTIGPADRPPPPPVNYVADLGGGGTFLAIGVLAALLERTSSGRGQVIDVAMVDGVASLTAFVRGLAAAGAWTAQRGANLLDGGAPFYTTYRCADGRFVAVAAIEAPFYAALCAGLGIDVGEWPQQDVTRWPALRTLLESRFAMRTRDDWAATFGSLDACVEPVLDLDEAPMHPHHVARGTFTEVDGHPAPAPAPRLSRTPGRVRSGAPAPGQHSDEVLVGLGVGEDRIAQWRAQGIVG